MMSMPITIQVYPSELVVKTPGEPTRVPIQDPSCLHGVCMNWSIEIARLCEKYGQDIILSPSEQQDAINALASIGGCIAHRVFNGELKAFREILQRYPALDIRVIGEDIWIPWELLYFESGDLSLAHFCGFQRNIYRASPSRGRKQPFLRQTSVGFLAHRRVPLVGEEMEILRDLRATRKIAQEEWISIGGKDDWRAKLSSVNIVHFAGLIAPIRYLEKSMILVDEDHWILPTGFPDPTSDERPFVFNAAPLVLFNVRDNYARNPEHILEYVNVLREKEALGVLTSEFPIPTILAKEFAKYFYHCLFADKKSIDQALTDTKDHFLQACRNPFAMLYAPYLEPTEVIDEVKEKNIDVSTKNQGGKGVKVSLSNNDFNQLIEELNALPSWIAERQGERGILLAAGLPNKLVLSYHLTGVPATDAAIVISNLVTLGHLEDRPTHYVLGALVEYLLKNTPHVEGKIFLAYLLRQYHLITDLSYQEELLEEYGLLEVPALNTLMNLGWPSESTVSTWQGPVAPEQLEAMWSQRARYLDAWFLEKGSRVARSVCRIEAEDGSALGTGFAVGPNLILTNDHVIPKDGVEGLRIRFGYRLDEAGKLKQGQICQILHVLRQSSKKLLDYAVLEVEGSPGDDPGIGYLKPVVRKLKQGSPAYIIQHPRGDPQKVVLQDNWITYVADDQRRVQYLTNTEYGSSGSPIFNDKWEVVALHHSRAPLPASPRTKDIQGNEGIPMAAILPEIEDLLPK